MADFYEQLRNLNLGRFEDVVLAEYELGFTNVSNVREDHGDGSIEVALYDTAAGRKPVGAFYMDFYIFSGQREKDPSPHLVVPQESWAVFLSAMKPLVLWLQENANPFSRQTFTTALLEMGYHEYSAPSLFQRKPPTFPQNYYTPTKPLPKTTTNTSRPFSRRGLGTTQGLVIDYTGCRPTFYDDLRMEWWDSVSKAYKQEPTFMVGMYSEIEGGPAGEFKIITSVDETPQPVILKLFHDGWGIFFEKMPQLPVWLACNPTTHLNRSEFTQQLMTLGIKDKSNIRLDGSVKKRP